jgi:hypothetical protein
MNVIQNTGINRLTIKSLNGNNRSNMILILKVPTWKMSSERHSHS